MDWKRIPKTYDYLLALAVIALGVFGVLMVYASVHADFSLALPRIVRDFGGLWRQQRLYVITGTILMIAVSMVDYRYIMRFYLYIYGAMIFFLIVALVFFNPEVATARSVWIPIPFLGVLSMQPSEFSKIFMMVFLAKFLSLNRERFNKPLWLGLVLILVALPVALVVMQPSLSASLVVLCIALVIIFAAGLYWRTILIGGAILAPVAVVVAIDLHRTSPIFVTRFLQDFQWRRIETFIRPQYASEDALRQTTESLYAIGTGGLTGRGFLQNPYVALGHNDFIFSVTASQYGFVGATILLGIVAFVIARCVLIALKSADAEGRFFAAGVAGMILFETFFHVGVATAILPNTGMPFPFMSSGGSMVWVHMIAIGIVLNIGLPRKPKSIFDEPESTSENP
ncbi:MAG: FtsW/RodA/SpoVE family cell cycle protein [Defluviitaleaceae bacterium]|nr:FtsW/RodA/SpoVE family cell cycle protein [Defluviitaleaceae bacterium]